MYRNILYQIKMYKGKVNEGVSWVEKNTIGSITEAVVWASYLELL